MQQRFPIYVVDSDPEQYNELSAVFNFIGETCERVEKEELLDKVNQVRPLAIILDAVSSDLFQQFPRSAFLTLSGVLDVDNENHIAILSKPITYATLMQFLYYCQSFNCPKQKSHKTNKYLVNALIGRGERIQDIRYLIEQVADSKANVLILGESGTGKEVAARAIHEISKRHKGPFVPINCGAIPAELLESELFGHEKGAFTGAFAMRKGRFELAYGGTLFLDEIGDMPMPMQVKLLRVLQERTFERVGGVKTIQADVRIIAATHRNLETLIEEGKFREDLYYRLNVFPIEKPALRDRCEDIPLLLQELLARLQLDHKATLRFTQRALESLMAHNWPGNVRELSNLLERLLILNANQIVDLSDLPIKYRYVDAQGEDTEVIEYSEEQEAIAERDALCDMFADIPGVVEDAEVLNGSLGFLGHLPQDGMNLKDKLTEFEIEMIKQALDSQDGVVSHAAELLSMRRTTLVEKMKKYGLSK